MPTTHHRLPHHLTTTRPQLKQLLPISVEFIDTENAPEQKNIDIEYIFEPNYNELVPKLIEQLNGLSTDG